MSMTFFCIPVFSPEAQSQALNEFLRKHPQARVDRQLIVDGQHSAWAVCCTVPDEGMFSESVAFSQTSDGAQRKRIDYREILTPEHFAGLAGALMIVADAIGGSLNQLSDLFHLGGQTQDPRHVSRQCRRSPLAQSLPVGRLFLVVWQAN